MTESVIREYEEKDFDRVVQLLRQLQEYIAALDTENLTGCTPDYGPEELRGYLKDVTDNEGACFIGEQAGTIVGFVQGIVWRHDDAAYLRSHTKSAYDGWVGLLVVDHQVQREGLGAKLLKRMEEYFKNKGCTSSRIKVFAGNQNAQAFYRHAGYAERDIELHKNL